MRMHRPTAALRAMLLAFFLATLAVSPSASLAQGRTRPMDCPSVLQLKFLGLTTFRHAGYTWDTPWHLRMPLKVGQGYYVPPDQPLRIYSTDRRAVWKNPGIIVACMAYELDLYFLEINAEYWVEAFLGTVEEICGGGTGGGGGSGIPKTETEPVEVSIYEDSYDPYAPTGSNPDCSGGSGDGPSGTQFHPGDFTGGETVDWSTGVGNGGESACGAYAKVEFVCIDIWNPETQQWETYSCGYATTC